MQLNLNSKDFAPLIWVTEQANLRHRFVLLRSEALTIKIRGGAFMFWDNVTRACLLMLAKSVGLRR